MNGNMRQNKPLLLEVIGVRYCFLLTRKVRAIKSYSSIYGPLRNASRHFCQVHKSGQNGRDLGYIGFALVDIANQLS